MAKGRFASRETVALDEEEQSKVRRGKRAHGSAPVEVTPGDAGRVIKDGMSALTKLVLGVLVAAVVLYLGLSATLMTVAPGSSGLTWVMRGTFVAGQPQAGDYVYASTSQAVKDTAPDKLGQAFGLGVTDDAVFEVVGGPHHRITLSEDGEILAHDQNTGFFPEQEVEEGLLIEEYLAICILGNCEPGEYVFVPASFIAGEARGSISTEGVGGYDSYRTAGAGAAEQEQERDGAGEEPDDADAESPDVESEGEDR